MATLQRHKRQGAAATNSGSIPKEPALSLCSVFGITADRPSMFAQSPCNNCIAYPAGSVVVLHDLAHDKQVAFLHHSSNNSITSLAFSSTGGYLAVGEGGRQPTVAIWDLSTFTLSCELYGHTFGVACVAFSPVYSDIVVSIGVEHDAQILVYNWRTGTKLCLSKINSKVNAFTFLPDGLNFVTVGQRLVKYWRLQLPDESIRVKTAQVVEGRAATLRDHHDATFVDALCFQPTSPSSSSSSSGDLTRVFVLTAEGVLCSISTKKVLERWVGLKSPASFGLCQIGQYIACACQDGVVRLFNQDFRYVTTLPRGPSLPRVPSDDKERVWADCVAVRSSGDHLLTCLYSDRSLIQWNLSALMSEVCEEATPIVLSKVIELQRTLYFSNGCIWALEIRDGARGIVTCSSEGCIRLTDVTFSSIPSANNCACVVPVEPDLSLLKRRHSDATEFTGHVNKQGLRCLKLSQDNRIAVTGDREGNLRVHDASAWTTLAVIQAHDSEIVTIDIATITPNQKWIVASGSRDRLIHVFNVCLANNQATVVPLQTLDEHTSSITSVLLTAKGTMVISASADKSIIFRSLVDGQYRVHRQHIARQTVFDMWLTGDGSVAAVGQDKRLHVIDKLTAQIKQTIKPDAQGEHDVALLKICLDVSGTVAAVSAADKTVRLVDLQTGEFLAKAAGHSDVVTGIRFALDGSRIISVSADGCLFQWKFVVTQLIAKRAGKSHLDQIQQENIVPIKLPAWARTKLSHFPQTSSSSSTAQSSNEEEEDQGRWGREVTTKIHSEVIGAPLQPIKNDRRLTIEPDPAMFLTTGFDSFSFYGLTDPTIVDESDATSSIADTCAPLFVTASITQRSKNIETVDTSDEEFVDASAAQFLFDHFAESTQLSLVRQSISSRFLTPVASKVNQPQTSITLPLELESASSLSSSSSKDAVVDVQETATASSSSLDLNAIAPETTTARQLEQLPIVTETTTTTLIRPATPPAERTTTTGHVIDATVAINNQSKQRINKGSMAEEVERTRLLLAKMANQRVVVNPKPLKAENNQNEFVEDKIRDVSLVSQLATARAAVEDVLNKANSTTAHSATDEAALQDFYEWMQTRLSLHCEQRMLEDYSNRLVAMVQAKLASSAT